MQYVDAADISFMVNAFCVAGLGKHIYTIIFTYKGERRIAIYLYDRCLTFKREATVIWCNSSISIVTGLYVLLHLSQGLNQLLVVVFNFMSGCEVSPLLLSGRLEGRALQVVTSASCWQRCEKDILSHFRLMLTDQL